MAFRLSFLKRSDLLFCISAYISGFWGLNVVTYGILLLSYHLLDVFVIDLMCSKI